MQNELDAASLSVLVDVRATIRRFVQVIEQACNEAGLTEPQQHALLCVAYGAAAGEEITATTLQDHLATDKNTVADIIRRLEAHGLLTRERKGRQAILSLTPAGSARFSASLTTLGRNLTKREVTAAAARLRSQLDAYLAVYREHANPPAAPDGSPPTTLTRRALPTSFSPD